MKDFSDVRLFRAGAGNNARIILQIGEVVRTVSIGEWSRFIANPEKPLRTIEEASA